MLRIADRNLAKTASDVLKSLQAKVDAGVDYPTRVALAKSEWGKKTSSNAKETAFRSVRATLDKMCVGPRRCAYCEDSLADEIEHILPKNLFPQAAFQWENYLFACGPCNGPKSNRYGVIGLGAVTEFVRKRGDAIVPPPVGISGCIDPRSEDPMNFLDLDLGGQTAEGEELEGTFNFVPAMGLSSGDLARATFSIEVLSLNREIMCVARANAFGGFRARLREYVAEKEKEAPASRLLLLRDDLLNTGHLTVFAEMRRQRDILPQIAPLFTAAPEALEWTVIRT
ncbi:hypothetical protein [Roseibium aggregatum]|uniref:hypothetical protein n=1 Tax=Roseibium aggregatum TaxID=187304 RepID=UPI001A8D0003|nr:hypothetical protein [Roseibium aggregatum]MBN8183116.1 hypothetical protein [Roseibium aggregatum]